LKPRVRELARVKAEEVSDHRVFPQPLTARLPTLP
jgi:hypothetical protein